MDDWSSVRKKDSFDRESCQQAQTFPELGRIRAVLVRKEGQTVGCEIDQGIPQNQGSCFRMEIARFPFARSVKGDFFKPRHFGFDFSMNQPSHFLSESGMVRIRLDNDHRGGGHGIAFRPRDGIEKNRPP